MMISRYNMGNSDSSNNNSNNNNNENISNLAVDKPLYQYNILVHIHYQYMDPADIYNKMYRCNIHHHYPDNMQLIIIMMMIVVNMIIITAMMMMMIFSFIK